MAGGRIASRRDISPQTGLCTDCRALRAAVHVCGRGRQVLRSSSIERAVELLVLVLASTLHPSREELVQLPGFAGLDVPLLLVLEEGGQLRDLPPWSCRNQHLRHLLAVL